MTPKSAHASSSRSINGGSLYEHMIIGVCRIELFIPQSRSLKNKRQVIKALKDKIKNRFNVSVAEVEHQELWQRCALGLAIVTNENQFIDKTVESILKLIDLEFRVEIIDYVTERR